MKVLLNECVPARLARLLTGHLVTTVQNQGGSGIQNGELFVLAEKESEVFISLDRKLSMQQDLTNLRIPIVLICARSIRLEDIRPLVSDLLKGWTEAKAGAVTVIGY